MRLIKNLLIYILAILVILQCYSLLSMIMPNRYFYIAINLVLILLIISEKRIILNSQVGMLLICYIIFMALLFTSGYYRNFEFILSVYIPFPLFILFTMTKNNFERFMEYFTNVILVISILSLVFFVFGSLMGVIQPTGYYPYTEVGWGTNNYKDYYHLYCEGQTVFALGYSGVRNIALFVEGPMLTYVISLAMYYELFLRENGFRKIVIGVFIATIGTSFSTTGILIAILLMYIKFYEVIKQNKYIKYILTPFIIIVVGYLSLWVMKDKFASNVYSASARTDDILASFKCFFSDIFNGVGYQNLDAIEPYRSFLRTKAGLSTGLGAILAYGGLLWGIWYIIPLVMAVKNYILRSSSRNENGFIIMANALLLVTVVQNRVLCTMVNAIAWYFILKTKKAIRMKGI